MLPTSLIGLSLLGREHMVFWTDSFEKAIKRSYIPGDQPDVNIGHAQDLQIKSRWRYL